MSLSKQSFGKINSNYFAKSTEQFISVLLLIILYNKVMILITRKSLDESPKCSHVSWKVSYRDCFFPVVRYVYCYLRGDPNYIVLSLWMKPWKSESYGFFFLWYCSLCFKMWFQFLRPWTKSLSVTTQMKATEQFFSLVQFLYFTRWC